MSKKMSIEDLFEDIVFDLEELYASMMILRHARGYEDKVLTSNLDVWMVSVERVIEALRERVDGRRQIVDNLSSIDGLALEDED